MKKGTLVIVFLSLIFVSNAQAKKSIFKGYAKEKAHWKNPAASFLLSTVIPGAGQMYNDQTYLGIGIFATEAVLIGGGFFFLKMTPTTKRNYNAHPDRSAEYTGYALLGVGGALYLAQLFHAPILSHKKNKANGFVQNKPEIDYNFGLAPGSDGGLALQLNF